MTGVSKKLIILISILIILSSFVLAEGFAHSQLKSPPMDPQQGKMWTLLTIDDVANLDIDNDYLALTQYNFTVKQNLSSPGVMIYRLVILPSELPEPPGRAYQYFKFDYTNMVYWDVKDSTFLFKVYKEWLDDKQSSADMISLFKVSGEKWEELPTRIVGFDDDVVMYYTEAEDLKYAVIAVRGAPSNFEEFQTVDSSTLFLQEIGTYEQYVVQDGEREDLETLEEEGLEDIAEEDVEDYNKTKESFKDQYFDKEGQEEDAESEEEKRSGWWVVLLLIAILIAILVYKLLMKPTIEKDVLDKIKKRK